MSACTSASEPPSLAINATVKPSSASLVAIALPIPRLAPVTIATRVPIVLLSFEMTNTPFASECYCPNGPLPGRPGLPGLFG